MAPREVENEIGSRHENETRLRGRSPGTGDGAGRGRAVGAALATGVGGMLFAAGCPLEVQATVSTTSATNQRLMEMQRVTSRKGDALRRAPLSLQLLLSRRRVSSCRAGHARRR